MMMPGHLMNVCYSGLIFRRAKALFSSVGIAAKLKSHACTKHATGASRRRVAMFPTRSAAPALLLFLISARCAAAAQDSAKPAAAPVKGQAETMVVLGSATPV